MTKSINAQERDTQRDEWASESIVSQLEQMGLRDLVEVWASVGAAKDYSSQARLLRVY